jgi:hypothetical protein
MSRESDINLSIDDDYGESHQYFIVLFPSGKGFRMACRLTKIIGGMLGRSWSAISPMDLGEKIQEAAGVLDGAIDGEAAARAIEMLASQILDEGGDAFVKEILQYTHRDGQKVDAYFETAFSGNYGELFEALYHTCKVNFGPFFAKRLGGWLSGLAPLLEKATALQTLSSSAKT